MSAESNHNVRRTGDAWGVTPIGGSRVKADRKNGQKRRPQPRRQNPEQQAEAPPPEPSADPPPDDESGSTVDHVA